MIKIISDKIHKLLCWLGLHKEWWLYNDRLGEVEVVCMRCLKSIRTIKRREERRL